MNNIYSLSPQELVLLSTTLALEITRETTIDQQNVLGNFLVAIGSIVLTSAAQGQSLKSKSDTANDTTNGNTNGSTKGNTNGCNTTN